MMMMTMTVVMASLPTAEKVGFYTGCKNKNKNEQLLSTFATCQEPGQVPYLRQLVQSAQHPSEDLGSR